MQNRILIPIFLMAFLVILSVTACNKDEESSTQSSTTVTSSPSSTTKLTTTTVSQIETSTTTESTRIVQGKEFIWKVSSDSTNVFLLGSIHIASESTYPLDGVIEKSFEIADNLVVEVDITNTDTNAIAELMLEYGTYPKDDSLKKNLPEPLYENLSEQFKRFGINIAFLDNFKPWIITTMLEQLIAEDLGYKAELGIDYYFLNKATASGKDIHELETAEFQIEQLSSFSDELMIRNLEEDVENTPTQDDFEELFITWEEGDIAKMESLVYEALIEKTELASYYEKMFDERNINMAKQIFDFLDDNESYFVVVGAGHLVGDKGLINLVKERQYTIIQLEDMD